MTCRAFAGGALLLLLLHDLDKWQYIFWKRPPVVVADGAADRDPDATSRPRRSSGAPAR